jgi:ABC-2 type transport system ATP-binding protein
LLILDEPTGGVDPVTRQDFWQLIIRLVAQEKIGVLVSTPYMDEASRCNRVGILSTGRIAVEGTPSDLCASFSDRILEVRGEPLVVIRKTAASFPEVEDVQAFGDRLHIRVQTGAARAVEKAIQQAAGAEGWQSVDIKLVQPQLEDVFIAHSEAERTNA